jgi:hypothetical protein
MSSISLNLMGTEPASNAMRYSVSGWYLPAGSASRTVPGGRVSEVRTSTTSAGIRIAVSRPASTYTDFIIGATEGGSIPSD